MMNIKFESKQNAAGQICLLPLQEPKAADADRLLVDTKKYKFPVFRQAARTYGDYSEYVEHHGCACCSLTTILAAFRSDLAEITPEKTIAEIEPEVFGRKVWQANYSKPAKKQMPVSMYGIAKVLDYYGIGNRYVREFSMIRAQQEIENHLKTGQPVIIETRKIRKEGWWISSLNDKKYAGSYHTMVCIGMDENGQVIFLDSAYRRWAGDYQRVKRAPLYDLLCYMYGKDNPQDQNVYFASRKYTGGYILVEDAY